MEMPRAWYAQMLAHVVALMPEEACGLLAGQDGRVAGLYPVENRLHSPTTYEMDPRAQLQAMLAMEAEGWEMLGIFHSHPQGPALPSSTDLAQAYYPDAEYVIISLRKPDQPVVRSFYLRDGQAQEVSFSVF